MPNSGIIPGAARWLDNPLTPTARRYTGQIEDAAIGLYPSATSGQAFYNARYYPDRALRAGLGAGNPALGRPALRREAQRRRGFQQADPANPQTLNLDSAIWGICSGPADSRSRSHTGWS